MPDNASNGTSTHDNRAKRTPLARAVFAICWSASRLVAILLYRSRTFGLHNVPKTGPVVIVMNHQSNFDPPLAGSALRRMDVSFIARIGLFSSAAFARFLGVLGAIPIRRGEPDLPAVKQALARLKVGRAVVVFAEGARTNDGAMQPFQRGTMLLLKKSQCPVLPVGIDGFRDIWPRGSSFPKLFGPRAAIAIGKPIPHDELLALPPEEALRTIGRRVENLRLHARHKLRRETRGRWPEPSIADHPANIDAWYTEGGPQPEQLSDAR